MRIDRTVVAVVLSIAGLGGPAFGELGIPGFLFSEGLDEFSRTGRSVGFGDFNGDGVEDLVIGAPGLSSGFGEEGSFEGGVPGAGGIHVRPGGHFAPLPTFVLQPEDVGLENQFEGGMGAALAVGDFDADGRDDLAVGVPGDVVNGVAWAGSVVVLYGRSGEQVILGDPEIFSQAPLSGAVEELDLFGSALAAGDLNGDGVDDLAIGVEGEDVTVGGQPVENAGAVNVVYGVEGVGLTTAGNQLLHHEVAGVDGTAGEDDRFGFSVAIGELTGDGFQDLAVGIPGMGDFLVGGEDGFGGVRVFRGSAGGIDLSSSEPIWFQGTPGVLGTPTDDDAFGWAIAIGDFDGNGAPDLAVGVPGEDEFGPDRSGAVQILYGQPGIGLDDAGDQFFFEGLFDGDVDENDRFGFALAAGDFDASGHDDLAIGAPWDNSLGVESAGEVTVLYGTDSGLSTAGAQLANMFLIDTLEEGDGFGWSLATGRYTGVDGTADLAIGVPGRDIDGLLAAGAAVVLFTQTLFADGFEHGDTDAWDLTVD